MSSLTPSTRERSCAGSDFKTTTADFMPGMRYYFCTSISFLQFLWVFFFFCSPAQCLLDLGEMTLSYSTHWATMPHQQSLILGILTSGHCTSLHTGQAPKAGWAPTCPGLEPRRKWSHVLFYCTCHQSQLPESDSLWYEATNWHNTQHPNTSL